MRYSSRALSEDQAINAAKQIRALDAGVKFSPQFAGTKVPSFEEALALAHGKIGVYGGAGFLRKVQAIGSSLKIVPEAYSAATLEKLLGDLKPRVVALDAGDFTDAANRGGETRRRGDLRRPPGVRG